MTTAPPPGDDQRPLQPAGADGAPGAAEAADGRNTGAIVALVFGLVGTVCALLGAGLLGAIAGVTAIVLGAEGRRKVDAGRTTRNRGVATAGLVTGIIAAVLGVLMMLLAAAEISTTLQDGPQVREGIERRGRIAARLEGAFSASELREALPAAEGG